MVFQLYVPNVSYILNVCCKDFIWMLQKWIGVLHSAVGGCPCVGRVVGTGARARRRMWGMRRDAGA
jgi:hypothetical protein